MSPFTNINVGDNSYPFSLAPSTSGGISPGGSTQPRFLHSGKISARGVSVLAFCRTITTPGIHQIARHVRELTIDFEDVRPTQAGLELVAEALTQLTQLTDLTLLGLPSRETDGWVLRNTTFSLTRFTTNLSLTSKDVLDFLQRQPQIVELSTTSPPAQAVQPISAGKTYGNIPFPNKIAPNVRTLDCPAPFLLSLLSAAPPTRPLVNLRIDLNRLNSQVEVEALMALSTFSSTVRRLSLRRSVLRTSPMSDSMVAMNMANVISRVATKRRWQNLEFLEMRDGRYDASSIPTLAMSISTCFPALKTLVWAPSSHPAGSTVVTPFIASIFFTFCRSLRRFIFLDDATDPEHKKYVSVAKQVGGPLRETEVVAAEVEDMWRAETDSA